MKKLGIVGGRGMVGTALLDRMESERDFSDFELFFYSSSQAGLECKLKGSENGQKYLDAYDVETLMLMDAILTVQGSDYSNEIYPKLCKSNYKGFFIDGSSAFREDPNSTLLLDPLNGQQIKESINQNKKLFCGANCTVSLLLLGLQGLIKADAIDWITSQTYQAVSGAGAAAISEYISQAEKFVSSKENFLKLSSMFTNEDTKNLGGPIFGNVLPWIDDDLGSGQSKEEWKAQNEASRILDKNFLIDGTCVRIGSFRVHAQALTIGLKKDIPLGEINDLLSSANEWVQIIDNNKLDTINKLTPLNYQNTLDIGVGRIRKLHDNKNLLNIFTLGDQLNWGAAEPLRRFLKYL